MDVTQAQDFIIERTLQPAVDSPVTSDRIKNLTKNSIRWVRKFKRTGDLIVYMDRFQGEAPPEIVEGLKQAGIETFEDIHDEFLALFDASKNDRTRLDDFVVGQQYSAFDINDEYANRQNDQEKGFNSAAHYWPPVFDGELELLWLCFLISGRGR